ncbi:MAG: DUF1003 domain-containing protein [Pyrinomonadaceae bacterium]
MNMATKKNKEDIANRFLQRGWEDLTEREQHVIERVVKQAAISHNTNQQFDDERTFGEKLADRIAKFGGSWTFIMAFFSILVAWVMLNSLILARSGTAFDLYPYILLNLFLSMLAALQAPVIMMAQNRQAAKDRMDAAHDYEVNLKAELEICGLHHKLDKLRDTQWKELITMQQRQIVLLENLLNLPDSVSNGFKSSSIT